jgi:hypothetical protein
MNVFGGSLEGDRNLIISNLENSIKVIEADIAAFKQSTIKTLEENQKNLKSIEENQIQLNIDISKILVRVNKIDKVK